MSAAPKIVDEKPPIDLEHLDMYVAGDAALLDEILTIFVEQAEAWTAKLAPYLEDEVWHNACHTLKGAARGVGAWHVGDLAERAEHLRGDGVIDERLALIQDIRKSVALTIEFARVTRDGR